MPVLHDLLRRWGFVKLRRYGLELTPDGRIVSTRPVLNDGTGARVVGWRDGDVSIWKLPDWSDAPDQPSKTNRVTVPPMPFAPPQQSAAVAPARPAAAAPPPPPPAILPPAVIAAPPLPAAPAAPAAWVTPERVPPSASVMPVDVAAEPTVDEDDWEWTIALARARVAVEETEVARPPEPAPRPSPRLIARAQTAARPPERPTPTRAASVKDPAASGEWPKTDLSGSIDYDDYSRVPTRPAMAIPRAEPPAIAIPRTTTPSTVIPVPALPTMATTATSACSRLEPVVRSTQLAANAVSRFAKGTGPVDPPSRPQAVLVEDTIPDLSVGDRTRPGIAAPTSRSEPPPGDRTRPGIALPPAARAVELPSIKRRMQPR